MKPFIGSFLPASFLIERESVPSWPFSTVTVVRTSKTGPDPCFLAPLLDPREGGVDGLTKEDAEAALALLRAELAEAMARAVEAEEVARAIQRHMGAFRAKHGV